MSRTTSKFEPGSRAGLTLVEVVASLALMGSLLVSALLGASAHLRQIRSANQKQAALAGIDRLLSAWALTQFSDQSLQEAANTSKVLLVKGLTPADSHDFARGFAMQLSLQPQSMSAGYEIEVIRVEAVSQTVNNTGNVLTWVEIARPKSSAANRMGVVIPN